MHTSFRLLLLTKPSKKPRLSVPFPLICITATLQQQSYRQIHLPLNYNRDRHRFSRRYRRNISLSR